MIAESAEWPRHGAGLDHLPSGRRHGSLAFVQNRVSEPRTAAHALAFPNLMMRPYARLHGVTAHGPTVARREAPSNTIAHSGNYVGDRGGRPMADIFTLILTGQQETPPVSSTASGAGTVIWDETDSTATYEITINGLDFGPALGMEGQTAPTNDDVTNMHVHNAARGVAGAVVFGQIGPAHDNDDLDIVLNADGSWTVRGI
jgi:CHRD domain